jgi:glutaredoxin 3
MSKLELFFFPSCPYCQIVVEVIEELELDVSYKNINKDPLSLQKLTLDTGRRTVPCLYIDNKPMHESQDIIRWLRSNVDRLPKVS